jgi:hypothetical protein
VREWFSLHAKTAADAEPGRADSRRLLRTFIDDEEADRIGFRHEVTRPWR